MLCLEGIGKEDGGRVECSKKEEQKHSAAPEPASDSGIGAGGEASLGREALTRHCEVRFVAQTTLTEQL